MSLVETIIQAVNRSKIDEFGALREKMKSKKPLSKTDFQRLVKVLQKGAIEVLSTKDLTMHEYQMIGKGLMASKLHSIDEIIRFVVSQDSKRTPVVLNCLLNKNCKVDVAPIAEYLDRLIRRETHLCHLKLLLTVSKNYPSLISSRILEFCELNEHPVCKEILNRHKVEVIE